MARFPPRPVDRFHRNAVVTRVVDGDIASVAYGRTGKVRGKYGRTLAHVWHNADGWCLNQRLLDPAAKLAWETDGHGSRVDERDLALLTGIPSK